MVSVQVEATYFLSPLLLAAVAFRAGDGCWHLPVLRAGTASETFSLVLPGEVACSVPFRGGCTSLCQCLRNVPSRAVSVAQGRLFALTLSLQAASVAPRCEDRARSFQAGQVATDGDLPAWNQAESLL